MRDPYLYEGSSVLKNKLGIREQDKLEDAEAYLHGRKGYYMYTIFICDDEQKILSDISRKATAVLSDAAVS